MDVSQQQIDLLNLSIPTLSSLIDKASLSQPPVGSTKLDYVRTLTSELSEADLETLASDYLYAGQTSLTWIRLGDGDEIELADLRTAITSVVGADAFAGPLRPSVTPAPKLVEAKVRDDGKVILVFVVSKPVRPVVRNFEVEMIHEDHFFLAVIRPDLGLVEVRSSQQRAVNLSNTFLAALADELGREQTFLSISKQELSQLKAVLGGKLHRYRGKNSKGSPIDIQDLYKAEDCDDLDTEQQFQTQTASCTPVQVMWKFDYGTDEVSVQVSSKGSIWFRSSVPEEVIDHVFSKLRQVKGF